MAAAEARAAWQRVANRYIVQEDAKRAPKLACCPSSSSKLQCDSETGGGESRVCNPDLNYMPGNWSPMNPNMSPDTKWWLQLQPNSGHQKEFIYEKLNKREDEEHGNKTMENITMTSKSSDELQPGVHAVMDTNENASSFTGPPSIVSTSFMKHDYETKVEELKAIKSDVEYHLNHKADLSDHWYDGDEWRDWKAIDQLLSTVPHKASFEMEPNWKADKTEPWWRVNDKDELALLVARKSSEHIENCDLPPPQKMHVSKDPFGSFGRFDDDEKLSSSFDNNLHAGMYKRVGHAHSSTSDIIGGKCMSYDEVSYSFYDSEKMNSSTTKCSAYSYDTIGKSSQDTIHASDGDHSKADLLEALCHSQTRARKAEIAAQKAYNEKEHIVKLFFRQASHLFAYKQWVRLLQLESLCLQLNIKEHRLSTLLPAMPWMPEKVDQVESGRQDKNGNKKGKKQKKCSFCRYMIAFAVGMSLASAGVLLGWTLGWLLPVT